MLPSITAAQNTNSTKKEFLLFLHSAGKDSSFNFLSLGLKTGFSSEAEAMNYLNGLPRLLASKGYPTASVDSFWQHNNNLHAVLYAGQKYNWDNCKQIK